MKILDAVKRSLLSIALVSSPWLLFIVLPSIPFRHGPTAFLLLSMVNGIGLIVLGIAVFFVSVFGNMRRWWWAIFACCLSLNVAYWSIKSFYYPDPPPPNASSLYFEYEPLFAMFAAPTVIVALIVGANFDRIFDRVRSVP